MTSMSSFPSPVLQERDRKRAIMAAEGGGVTSVTRILEVKETKIKKEIQYKCEKKALHVCVSLDES